MVLSQGVKLAMIGVALGLTLAWMLSRLLGSLLYGVSPRDLATFAASASAMMLVAVIASLVPAWRAARVDPMTALRQD